MHLNINLPGGLRLMVDSIKTAGGICMLIGGGVIDSIQNRQIKDWDVEVYNLSYPELEAILAGFGSPNLVGKAFGIIKIDVDDTDYDFSIPRLENRCGVGHKGFDVELNTNLTPEEAGRRRDLTINSMYLNLHTMELVDPFGGYNDLMNGVIRVTHPSTFIEDPLRVLRVMQLLPRKGKTVDPGTIDLCRSMIDEFQYLPKERIFEEFKKLLLKAEKPSMGLEFLRESGWVVHFPELNNLIGCAQNPEHHPEGDVWMHTLWCVDNAAKLKGHISEEWQLAYMFGALCHDLGKPSTTDPITLTAYGHDSEGGVFAESFMRRITDEVVLIQRVRLIAELHMQPGQLHRADSSIAAWKRLHNKLRLDVLAWISCADSCARPGRNMDEHEVSRVSMEYFETFGVDPIKPVVLGRHLIAKGMKPGKEFATVLARAYEVQLDLGVTDPDTLLVLVL